MNFSGFSSLLPECGNFPRISGFSQENLQERKSVQK